MHEDKEPVEISWNSNIEMFRESEKTPLPTLIQILFDMELPLPVYDHKNPNVQIGTAIYAELSERKDGTHVIVCGVANL